MILPISALDPLPVVILVAKDLYGTSTVAHLTCVASVLDFRCKLLYTILMQNSSASDVETVVASKSCGCNVINTIKNVT